MPFRQMLITPTVPALYAGSTFVLLFTAGAFGAYGFYTVGRCNGCSARIGSRKRR
jgi:hypothetical protein